MTTSQQRQVIATEDGPKVATEIDKGALRDKAELYVAKNLPKYLRTLHKLAMGLALTRKTKEGPEIFLVPPDRQALQYLIDRGLGKTPDRQEIVGADGETIAAVIPWAPVIALSPPEEPEDTVEAKVTVLSKTPEIVEEVPSEAD